MSKAVEELWPELEWIQDEDLRRKTAACWELALERSPLEPKDLQEIPFTLLVPNCPSTFMEHKRCVVHIARHSAEDMKKFLGKALMNRGLCNTCQLSRWKGIASTQELLLHAV